ncbi:MAG: DMT family transporter [Lachnospiraceae bacterium]|nr:DMT family transporter [Lachnospiraceae bacterium]
MKKTEWKSPALLFLTAVVWGVAFVAQSVGMDYVGPFTFNCIRCLIGAVVLVPCIWFLDGWKQRPDGASCGRESAGAQDSASCSRRSAGAQDGASDGSHALLAGGICCGLALFVASNLQQIGIQYTTVGKAGFITALYIVMVPVFGIFLKKRAGIRVWVSVALAVAGLYLLCITDRLALGKGDILVLLCAVVFAVHILVVDHFSAKADGVRMSCIQFLVCGLLSGVCMLITEHPEMRLILQAWQPILYAGVFSCGVGYTLQIVGQKGTDPTVASLILSLESVVSVLAGWLLLGQRLSVRELGGCALMFAAILLVQMPERR